MENNNSLFFASTKNDSSLPTNNPLYHLLVSMDTSTNSTQPPLSNVWNPIVLAGSGSNNSNIKQIIHISDIHIRIAERHDEYIQVFQNLFRMIQGIQNAVVVVTGDIVHSKLNLSTELIQTLHFFIESLDQLHPTFYILGNHDANMHNIHRPHALATFFDKELPYYPRLKQSYLLETSGIYLYQNIAFAVSSFLNPVFYTSAIIPKEFRKIALYHGGVGKYHIDNGISQMGTIGISTFDGYDAVLLGDIHLHQFLVPGRIAYAGSLIQQNAIESFTQHGYILWNLEDNKKTTFHCVHNPCGQLTISIKDTGNNWSCFYQPTYGRFEYIQNIPKVGNFIKPDPIIHQSFIQMLIWQPMIDKQYASIHFIIPHEWDVEEWTRFLLNQFSGRTITIGTQPITGTMTKPEPGNHGEDDNIADSTKEEEPVSIFSIRNRELFSQYFHQYTPLQFDIPESEWTEPLERKIMEEFYTIQQYMQQHPDIFMNEALQTQAEQLHTLTLMLLEWSNLLCYGAGNSINFKEMEKSKIFLVSGKNHDGKSAIVEILLFTLFNKTVVRGVRDMIGNHARSGSCSLIFQFNQSLFKIVKTIEGRYRNNDHPKQDIKLFLYTMDGWDDISEDTVTKTSEKIIKMIGPIERYVGGPIFLQGMADEFFHQKPAERKEWLMKSLNLTGMDQLHDWMNERKKNVESQISTMNKLQKTVQKQRVELQNQIMKTFGEDINQIETLSEKIHETQQYYDECLKESQRLDMEYQTIFQKRHPGTKPAVPKHAVKPSEGWTFCLSDYQQLVEEHQNAGKYAGIVERYHRDIAPKLHKALRDLEVDGVHLDVMYSDMVRMGGIEGIRGQQEMYEQWKKGVMELMDVIHTMEGYHDHIAELNPYHYNVWVEKKRKRDELLPMMEKYTVEEWNEYAIWLKDWQRMEELIENVTQMKRYLESMKDQIPHPNCKFCMSNPAVQKYREIEQSLPTKIEEAEEFSQKIRMKNDSNKHWSSDPFLEWHQSFQEWKLMFEQLSEEILQFNEGVYNESSELTQDIRSLRLITSSIQGGSVPKWEKLSRYTRRKFGNLKRILANLEYYKDGSLLHHEDIVKGDKICAEYDEKKHNQIRADIERLRRDIQSLPGASCSAESQEQWPELKTVILLPYPLPDVRETQQKLHEYEQYRAWVEWEALSVAWEGKIKAFDKEVEEVQTKRTQLQEEMEPLRMKGFEQKQIRDRMQELAESEKGVSTLNELTEYQRVLKAMDTMMFSKHGFQLYLVCQIIEHVVVAINETLQYLTDFQVLFRMDSDVANGKGKKIDRIDFSFLLERKGGKKQPYDIVLGSGFERFIVAILWRIHLSRLVHPHKKLPLNWIIFDESFHFWDYRNLGQLDMFFQYITQYAPNVLLITHIPQVSDFAQKSLSIQRIDGLSYAQYPHIVPINADMETNQEPIASNIPTCQPPQNEQPSPLPTKKPTKKERLLEQAKELGIDIFKRNQSGKECGTKKIADLEEEIRNILNA